MLSVNDIAAWGGSHPWASPDQVEQDLLLSRAICAIAADSYLGRELVFRGGTALHKLHLPCPLRYSEDLDYVRSTGGGIGQLTGVLLDLGRDLGFDVKSRLTGHPKVYWRATDLEPDAVLAGFGPYRLAGYTSKAAIANLQAKLAAPDFRDDLDQLAAQPPAPYDADEAAAVVTGRLLHHLQPVTARSGFEGSSEVTPWAWTMGRLRLIKDQAPLADAAVLVPVQGVV
ncbi:MAG: nucleotidyl transferase AbiEii/AbiGii toxin family protein [Bifidobacteriaceae bacterium]|jgi:hypothetical protein|nr:nucleotidyl transferase AbiEii/AbiGii toxin family protein [Bifidobacteriaceae bacterium]